MSRPEPVNELLTPAAVAAVLFVDPKTVTRWARAGKIHSIRTPGGHRRFLRTDVMALLEPTHENTDGLTPPGGAGQEPPAASVDTLSADAVLVSLEAEADAATEAVRVAVSALVAASARADAATHAREARVLATRAAWPGEAGPGAA